MLGMRKIECDQAHVLRWNWIIKRSESFNPSEKMYTFGSMEAGMPMVVASKIFAGDPESQETRQQNDM